MNTSAEFFEWILQSEGTESDCCKVLIDDECSQPSLAPSFDSENSSLAEDASFCSASTDYYSAKNGRSGHRRRVSFNKVEVREYAVTVGDHPFCYDGLPLTLDWEHGDLVFERDIEESRERTCAYKAPKRLSYEERRSRLLEVSSYSDERVRNEELNMVIQMLQSSWAMNTILPAPKLEDIEEIEEEEVAPAPKKRSKPLQAPKPQVFSWKRMQRQQSFYDDGDN